MNFKGIRLTLLFLGAFSLLIACNFALAEKANPTNSIALETRSHLILATFVDDNSKIINLAGGLLLSFEAKSTFVHP